MNTAQAASSESSSRPFRYAVLASGGGSNFQAILDSAFIGHHPAELAFVASNNSGSGALRLARVPKEHAYHVSAKTAGSEEGVAKRLIELLDKYDPQLLVLAGYMKKVPDAVLKRMKNRVINIHPALLPEFGGAGMYGHHVHEAVARAGSAFSGMTIHMVNENYDEGQVVLQRRVAVPRGATPDVMGGLVLAIEHDSYWRVLKAFAEGDIVPTDSDDPAEAVRINPAWSARMRALDGARVP